MQHYALSEHDLVMRKKPEGTNLVFWGVGIEEIRVIMHLWLECLRWCTGVSVVQAQHSLSLVSTPADFLAWVMDLHCISSEYIEVRYFRGEPIITWKVGQRYSRIELGFRALFPEGHFTMVINQQTVRDCNLIRSFASRPEAQGIMIY